MSDHINRIVSLLFSAGRVFHGQPGGSHRPDFVSMLRLHTLRYVHEADRPLMKEVAQYLSITPSSATSLINSLVKAKLLARQLDRGDRRIVRLSLTAKGRTFLTHGLAAKRSRLRRVLRRLNNQERNQLIHILRKITTLSHTSPSV